ncbi:MAG TPA: transposase [Opitutaceae bacterium]|nr:transposase [Opitutaceae bacterium]
MARKLRIQYPGAVYHVINRGNYRRDVFETAGAARAFEATLAETCRRYGWRVHAYVIMRNHYHLALETPRANLVEGMHWLQSTFATRFNRYRSQNGHLFQGRYQALLVEDHRALARLVHYINLNPVRAGVVEAAEVASFRWGSLRHFAGGDNPSWLTGEVLLSVLNLGDTTSGWKTYAAFLTALAGERNAQEEMEFDSLCRGWAIGTAGWRKALAREHSKMALQSGFEHQELREIKETRWRDELQRMLGERGESTEAAHLHAKPAPWKIEMAAELRLRVDAPYRWIAEVLSIARPASLRMQIHRRALHVSA